MKRPHQLGGARQSRSPKCAGSVLGHEINLIAHSLSTLSPERYQSGPKTATRPPARELPRWSFHPLEITSFSCRTLICTTSPPPVLRPPDVPTINLTDDELAAVTAAIRRAVEDDKYPHAPRLDPLRAAVRLIVGTSGGGLAPSKPPRA